MKVETHSSRPGIAAGEMQRQERQSGTTKWRWGRGRKWGDRREREEEKKPDSAVVWWDRGDVWAGISGWVNETMAPSESQMV